METRRKRFQAIKALLNHHDRFGRLLVAGKEYIAFIAKQLDMSIFFQFPQILMVKNGYRSAELVLHAKGNNPHYPLGILLLGLKPFIRAKNLLVKHPIPTFILSNHRENILQGRQDVAGVWCSRSSPQSPLAISAISLWTSKRVSRMDFRKS